MDSSRGNRPPPLPAVPTMPIVKINDSQPLLPKTKGNQIGVMSFNHRWLEYRNERTSSSSSDSGIQLSPPNPSVYNPVVPSMASMMTLSPPGLSPLTLGNLDSPFNTPTSSGDRFTFDHVPFERKISDQTGYLGSNTLSPGCFDFPTPSKSAEILDRHVHSPDMLPSAFDIPSSSKSFDRLNEVLRQVRHHENGHSMLQRKQSVIHSTRSDEPPAKAPLMMTQSCNIHPTTISVSVHDGSMERIMNTTQLFLGAFGPSSAHSLLSPSLSSPISSAADSMRPSPMGVSPRLSPNGLSPSRGFQKVSPRVSPNVPQSPTIKNQFEMQRTPITQEIIEEDGQFFCEECSKDFRRPDILSRHMRRHTGEKPFGCELCGRFFSRSDHLRTHRRTHTDEKPYQCTVCSYAARRRDVLTRHMTTRHNSTNFPKHRDVRRTLSDGPSTISPQRNNVIQKPARRIRNITETSQQKQRIENRGRGRAMTEVRKNKGLTGMDPEQIQKDGSTVTVIGSDFNVTRNRLLSSFSQIEQDQTTLTPNEIEDDVIIDVCEEDNYTEAEGE